MFTFGYSVAQFSVSCALVSSKLQEIRSPLLQKENDAAEPKLGLIEIHWICIAQNTRKLAYWYNQASPQKFDVDRTCIACILISSSISSKLNVFVIFGDQRAGATSNGLELRG